MKHLWTLNPFFLKYKWHFFGGLLFVSLATIFGTYQGILVRDGTNAVIAMLNRPENADPWLFVRYGLLMVSMALVSAAFMFLMRQTIIVMSRHIEFDQKNQLYDHYQQMDAGFFKTVSTGDLMNRISEDVGRVRMYTGPAIMYLANTIVTTITILVFMLSVSPRMTALVLLPLPILSFIIYRISDVINRQGTRVQEELGNLTSQAQETFSAIRMIKAYARENFFIGKMSAKGHVYRTTALKLASTEALFAPVMSLMVGLSVLITVWYGGRLVILGEISNGNITEFVFYVFRLIWPFASLGWVTSLIQRAAASQERINAFLHRKPVIVNHNNDTYPVRGEIEFKNVTFVYPENNIMALKNVNFTLKAGQTLGITGQVGSGKTTILTLLTRGYDATSGTITIDGRPIEKHNLYLLKRSMGVVPQESFLFSDTIANNIAFGTKKPVQQSDIEQAAKEAVVHENIVGFPEGYQTVVGERGVTLSGGQKQRISIARAIIGKPSMLFFDDCLSAVDTETEAQILSYLKKEMKGRTSIIVSHRVSSIQHADLILYLKNGEIDEMGTHEELMALDKHYAQLQRLQAH